MFHAFGDLLQWVPLGLPAFVFVITVVVFFHELGHFAMARAFGIGVEAFSIGFGPAIVSWTDSKATRWKISWIPLGGYVKFLGDADAASTPDREKLEHMSAEERRHAFQDRPLYQRALVVAAGPAANFVLAILIFATTFMTVGREIVRPVVDSVQPRSAAAAAGFKPGDRIQAVDGDTVETFADLKGIVAMSAGRALAITVLRDGKTLTLHATPQRESMKDPLGNMQRVGVLGVVNRVTSGNIEHVRYSVFGAIGAAGVQTWLVVDSTMTYLWRMVAGQEDASQLSGPVGIARVSEQVASIGFMALSSWQLSFL